MGSVILAMAPGLSHAWTDPAGAVLGTSYNNLMAYYPSVISATWTRTTSGARAAHNHSQSSQSASACTQTQYVYVGGGTRQVTPFQGGWVCLAAGVLYDEFITNPVCNGNARCAMLHTLSYFSEHAKQLTPQNVGPWWLVYNLAYFFSHGLVDVFRMCIDTPGCSDTQGIGACDQDPNCINGMAYDMQLEEEYYEAANQPVPAGDYGLYVQEYYDMLGVGDEQSYMTSLLGAPVGSNSYDAGYGYGAWGELTPEALGGEVSCPIVTPACP